MLWKGAFVALGEARRRFTQVFVRVRRRAIEQGRKRLSEMEVDNTFFLLEKRGEKPQMTLHSNQNTALKRIRRYFQESVSTEDVKFFSITLKGDKLEVEQVPWSTVALKLVQLGEE